MRDARIANRSRVQFQRRRSQVEPWEHSWKNDQDLTDCKTETIMFSKEASAVAESPWTRKWEEQSSALGEQQLGERGREIAAERMRGRERLQLGE